MTARLVVLASGPGERLQSLLDACADPAYGARVAAVGSDRGDSGAVERSRAAGVAAFVVPVDDYDDVSGWDRAMCDEINTYEPTFVVCAGFAHPLGPVTVGHFAGRLVTTHPSLLPAFPGPDAVTDALSYGAKVTGATVHLVTRGAEPGPVVAQAPVVVRSDDDEHTLGERIAMTERALLVHAVGRLARGGLKLEGRKVILR